MVATAIVLAAFGLLAVGGGAWVWRNAEKLVSDARRQLLGMFGDQFPGLADEKPDPLGGRITGAAFALVGVALLVASAFAALG